jgi:hypothetical protein
MRCRFFCVLFLCGVSGAVWMVVAADIGLCGMAVGDTCLFVDMFYHTDLILLFSCFWELYSSFVE